jgi:hypothetical protein
MFPYRSKVKLLPTAFGTGIEDEGEYTLEALYPGGQGGLQWVGADKQAKLV